MKVTRFSTVFLSVVLAATVLAAGCRGAAPAAAITSPKAQLGFEIGDDYQLANYTQLSEYWKKLDQESDRLKVVEYGTTSEGRPMLMGIITSPQNHQKLDRYKEIARQLALVEGLTDDQARSLAAEGKAVVWIDAGLHATEVANAQALTEMVYQMVSQNDAETERLLNDVIFLAAFSNPDGLELVANWYMREQDPTKRSTNNVPVLYQKYIGHDNNREYLLANMPESESVSRVLYREWFPQIMYNQHQTGPAGAVLFIGAMRDPSNPYLDPLMAPSMELVSSAVHRRYITEGKPGAVCRSLASYQNWWNGGIRSTACFHNEIGILSEISGNPTPMEISFIPRNLVATNDNPFPIQPQKWHFRQAIDYLLTADRAMLDVASKHREDLLFNIFRMGKNSIEKGSTDTWTATANKVAVVEAALAKDQVRPARRAGYPVKYYEPLNDPLLRDPRGYIIPSDQPDFLTATTFVNALIKNGVTVHRASQPFEVAGHTYPAGSYVVKTAQAFRPHIMDNFERHDYPNDFAYPGGPPIRPYDTTGNTLAYQMGVQFDRILNGFDGPFEKVEGFAKAPAGAATGTGEAGFLLSHQVNDVFKAIGRLLAAGEDVYWLRSPLQAGGKSFPAGTVWVQPKPSTAANLAKLAEEVGLSFERIETKPSGEAFRLRPVRVGVWDQYGGSMPSGWVQWLLERQEIPYEVVYAPALDAGNLRSKYDVLIFEDGAIAEPDRAEFAGPSPDPKTIPPEYRGRLGRVTKESTVPQLRRFLDDGGTVLAVGSSTSLAAALGLPIRNYLTEEGTNTALPPEKFYVPGALLRVRVDNSQPLAYGLPDAVDVVFDNSPVFRLGGQAGMQPVAWFDSDQPLRSGWAWGQEYLKGGVAVIQASVGKGRLCLFGPLIAFRAHPHGSFKFLFNGIYLGAAEAVTY